MYVSTRRLTISRSIDLKVGSAQVKTPPTLKPMSEQAVTVPAGTAGTVSWRAINDFGGITDVRKANI